MGSLRRGYERLLFAHTHWDLWFLAFIGALPLLLSPLDHTFYDVHITDPIHLPPQCAPSREGIVFHGLESSRNWWIFIFFLPASLYLLRRAISYFIGKPNGLPPLAYLINESERAPTAARVRGSILTLWIPAIVIVIIGIVAFLDLGDVVPVYTNRICPTEKDWTSFFILPYHGTSAPLNGLHVAIAYLVQYLTGFFGLMAFGLAFVHNLIYLRLIYQRRRAKNPSRFITLDLDDPECCFGQDVLRPAFRIQVWYVVIAGIAISVSRYHNVAKTTMQTIYSDLERAITEAHGALGTFVGIWKVLREKVDPGQLFPDKGQWSLAVIFVIVFLVVSLPSLIKFLPFGRRGMLTEGDMGLYLAEFIPPGSSPEPTEMDHDDLHELAGKFARNSFWPASDEVAKRLFAFAFIVLIFILLPVPLRPASLVAIYAALVFFLSLALTAGVFLAYEYVLAYIGKPLVTPPKD